MDCAGPSTPRPDLSEGASNKRARPRYGEAQKSIIERCIRQRMGYRETIKQHPDMGFRLDGLKSACARWKQSGALGRKVGSGATGASRTDGAVEGARVFFEENDRAICGGAVSQLGLSRGTARCVVGHDLDSRPLRGISTHRVMAENLEMRHI